MTQLKYKNTRVSLMGEMKKLKHRLMEANTDLGKFKDVGISVQDHIALVVRLKIHQNMLQRKMTLCNDKLRQLHSTIEHVASKEQNWTMEYLTMEFEQIETQYEGLYRNFQEYLRNFKV